LKKKSKIDDISKMNILRVKLSKDKTVEKIIDIIGKSTKEKKFKKHYYF